MLIYYRNWKNIIHMLNSHWGIWLFFFLTQIWFLTTFIFVKLLAVTAFTSPSYNPVSGILLGIFNSTMLICRNNFRLSNILGKNPGNFPELHDIQGLAYTPKSSSSPTAVVSLVPDITKTMFLLSATPALHQSISTLLLYSHWSHKILAFMLKNVLKCTCM